MNKYVLYSSHYMIIGNKSSHVKTLYNLIIYKFSLLIKKVSPKKTYMIGLINGANLYVIKPCEAFIQEEDPLYSFL